MEDSTIIALYFARNEEAICQTDAVQVFSVTGTDDSPAYQAAQEWFAFTQYYDPESADRPLSLCFSMLYDFQSNRGGYVS